MTELKAGTTYYVSHDWPALIVTLIAAPSASCSEALVRAPSGPVYVEWSRMYATRLEADEATLRARREQLANCEARVEELKAEIAELEEKKGQA